jgi:hypothetical protein
MSRKSLKQTSMNESIDHLPKNGDVYQCEGCGMEIEITADCGCEEGPRFECRGQPMSRAAEAERELM